MFGQAGFVGSSSRAWDWDFDDRKTKRVVAAATPAVDCCILAELEGCASHDGHIDVLEWPCLFMRLPASEERWQNRQSWIVMGMAEARQARCVEIERSRIRGLKGCEADRFYVGGMRDSVRETNYQAPMKSCCDLAAANRRKQAGASRSGAPGFSKARTSVLMRDGGIRMGCCSTASGLEAPRPTCGCSSRKSGGAQSSEDRCETGVSPATPVVAAKNPECPAVQPGIDLEREHSGFVHVWSCSVELRCASFLAMGNR